MLGRILGYFLLVWEHLREVTGSIDSCGVGHTELEFSDNPLWKGKNLDGACVSGTQRGGASESWEEGTLDSQGGRPHESGGWAQRVSGEGLQRLGPATCPEKELFSSRPSHFFQQKMFIVGSSFSSHWFIFYAQKHKNYYLKLLFVTDPLNKNYKPFFWYIYWLCYYGCPISAPSHNSILPTPSLPHSPPIVQVHGSYL